MAGRTDKLIAPHIREGETVEASLRGLIAGYTRWSTIGSVVAVLIAFTLVSVLRLNFIVALMVLLVAIVAAFMGTLSVVGKPLARRHDPSLNSPYVSLAVTNRRVLLIEQGTGKEISTLAEETLRSQISHVEYERGGMLSPQRLRYRTHGDERAFEFPRMERVALFVEALKG